MSINFLDELEPYLDQFPKYKIRGNKLISCSPFREDNSPSFAVNLDNGTFIDSGSEIGSYWHKGNFYKLITFFTKETTQDAFKRLFKGSNIDTNTITLDMNLKPLKQPLNALEEVAYTTEIRYLRNRGIGEDVQRLFNVSEESNVIKFPIYDRNGKLVNIKYRKINRKVFWYDTDGEPVKQHIYGLDKCKGKSDVIYLVEGEVDVLSMFELGFPCGGTFGASFTERQMGLLASNFKEVIVIPDNDSVGLKHAERVAKRLGGFIKVGICLLPDNVKDVNEYLLSEKRETIINHIKKERRRMKLWET